MSAFSDRPKSHPAARVSPRKRSRLNGQGPSWRQSQGIDRQSPMGEIKEHYMIVCQLSTLMGARRMNQSQLAARTGIHRDTIRKLYHDGWTSIRRDTLDRLCTILETSVSEFFVWRPEQPS